MLLEPLDPLAWDFGFGFFRFPAEELADAGFLAGRTSDRAAGRFRDGLAFGFPFALGFAPRSSAADPAFRFCKASAKRGLPERGTVSRGCEGGVSGISASGSAMGTAPEGMGLRSLSFFSG